MEALILAVLSASMYSTRRSESDEGGKKDRWKNYLLCFLSQFLAYLLQFLLLHRLQEGSNFLRILQHKKGSAVTLH